MVQRRTSRRVLALGALAVLTIISLVIAVAILAQKLDKNNTSDGSGQQLLQDCKKSSAAYFLQHFGVTDGLDLRWFPGANSRDDINTALKEKVHVIEVPIVEDGGKFYSQKKDISLTELLHVLMTTSTAIKINHALDVPGASRLVSTIKSLGFTNPVIISVPLLASYFNLTQFMLEVKNIPENIIINVDMNNDCCDKCLGHGTVEFIDTIFNNRNSYACVEMSTGCVKDSWDTVRWLLNKNKFLALILSANASVAQNASFDALIVRNDIDQDIVLYNFDRTLYDEFCSVASTAGSSLLYFDIKPRDAGKIIWSHNTDTWDLLNAATSGDVMMIEGDIQVLGQGTPNQTDIPIMGHDIGDFNNLTFEQWLEEIIKVDKGMKFDFKTIDGMRPALQIVKSKRAKIKGPIWLNADILKGPNAGDPRVPKDQFLAVANDFPEATLSLGWTTVAKGAVYDLQYTMTMVQEMHDLCKNLQQPITFPVRAEQVVSSWKALDWLLQQSRGYTLTIWTSATDNVTQSDMNFVKRQAEAARVYFDLPENLRPYF